jgi:hypothetical protein
MHTRLNVLEAFYTKQVQLVENMAKEMNDIALLIQKQVDINNDQIKYINNLKTAVIVLSVFLFICIITIGYLIFTKP